MSGAIWAIGELGGRAGCPPRINGEVATLVRTLANGTSRPACGVVGSAAALVTSDMAEYLPRVVAFDVPSADGWVPAMSTVPAIAALVERECPAYLFVGSTPDGRDLAGFLSAALGWPVLVNAVGVSWDEGRLIVEVSVFGGKATTRSVFTGSNGIVTVRPHMVTASPADELGTVELYDAPTGPALPMVRLVNLSQDESAATEAVEEANTIVAGGRGTGGRDGFHLVEELASVMGAAVGATRPAVDEGWIDFSHQIGQTGKIVKPELYVAVGISGAIQHRVGMQTAKTIVAVDRDADAPIAELADMFVIGDLFEVVPELIAQLRARSIVASGIGTD